MTTHRKALLFGALATLLAATPALAVTSNRTQVQNGAGACQGALPTFDTNLRQRPLGVNNEGTANAFVTCSMKSSDFYDATNTFGGVGVTNTTAAALDITCTYVSGVAGLTTPLYFTKTTNVPAGTFALVTWDPTIDNAGNPFQNTDNYSCLLPPGTQLNFIFGNVDVDVDA